MRTMLMILACAAALCCSAQASPLNPVMANASFEEVAPGNDAPGWAWRTSAAAAFSSDTQDPHSGSRCLAFVNHSSLAPEVYGRLSQSVAVLPCTEYELSAWVRADAVAEGNHLTDWERYTLNIPEGTYGWRKITTTFKTGDSQTSLSLGINIVNKCAALAIDDISLRAVGIPLEGDGIRGSYIVGGQVHGDNAPAHLALQLISSLEGPVNVAAGITSGDETLFSVTDTVRPGENSFEWEWNTGGGSRSRLDLSMRVVDARGKSLLACRQHIEKVSPRVILAEVDRLVARLEELDALCAECRARGIPVDYPVVARTMVDQFIPLVRKDCVTGEERRARFAVGDMNRSLDQAIALARAYLADPSLAPNAVRYQTGRVDIDGINLIADRMDTRGVRSRGPVFFCGYGHFSQLRRDMHRWPGYGVNIIQFSEFGPSAVFPAEGEVSLDYVDILIKTLDDAAKHNVKVDFLISPHYFPQWAMEKWPHLAGGGGGFLGFCVDAPEAKQVVEDFIRLVMPLIKDKPALNSICLSNEPIFDRTTGADNTPAMWADYLKRTHGSVEDMNKRYGTSYADFTEVPNPGNHAYDAPQFYDYCVFNQQRFAGWHKWMADIIHEIAPDVPVHAKIMVFMAINRGAVAWGVDPELFGELSGYNGNDCYIFPASGGWGIHWHSQNLCYDLQRSLANKPVFNSENHLQPDFSTYYVAPEHYRTALWQGAIHGQGATTIWVWERSVREHVWSHPFYGNVMDRPGCAEAVGVTCLDLNRFADEVTALQNAEAPVAILFSMSSFVRNDSHMHAIHRIHEVLNFCGVKVDFISEKQLVAGKGSGYRVIVLPDSTHLPEAAMNALAALPASTQFVVLGETPAKDPYGRDLPGAAVSAVRARSVFLAHKDDTLTVLWPRLREELSRLGALPEVSVVDVFTGDPVWGVEWLPVEVGGRTVINIVNLLSKPVGVRIMSGDRRVSARDLLSLGGRENVKWLRPVVPVLAEVSR